jgi:outer membrane protein assembly factor BamB
MRLWGISAAIILSLAASAAYGENWPTWRGQGASGVSEQGNPPVTWSETENIKWKVKLPGTGSSTPVVWGDKMFFLTAVAAVTAPPKAEEPKEAAQPQARPERRGPRAAGAEGEGRPRGEGRRRGGRRGGGGRGGFGGGAPSGPYKFNVVCLDRTTGKIIWETMVREELPHEGHHGTASFASYSPVTDGELLWASFGSRGLHCLDLDGELKWSADLPQMATRNGFGEGSSPALAGDAVIVLSDQEGESKIHAFNKNTGALIWEKGRDERTSWATPQVVEVGDRLEVITTATNRIISYDAKTGDIIWETEGLTTNAIPSPVLGFGNVYCTSGFRGFSLKAIKLGNTGDLTGTDAIVWELDKGTPYISSPLLYNDKIYVTESRGAVMSCYDAQTGAPIFEEQELEGMGVIYSSPVGAAGRIYLADREGRMAVLKQSNNFEVLAMNTLDEGFDASPVVIGDELYLKGSTHLYCISEQ